MQNVVAAGTVVVVVVIVVVSGNDTIQNVRRYDLFPGSVSMECPAPTTAG